MCWYWKSSTHQGLPFYVETMRIDKSINIMDFMTNASRNMVMSLYGKCSHKFLCIYLYQLSLKTKFSAFMGVYLLKLNNLIKSNQLIEFKIFPIKALSVICYGLIQLTMIKKALALLQEAQDIAGEKMWARNFCIKITWKWYVELIN